MDYGMNVGPNVDHFANNPISKNLVEKLISEQPEILTFFIENVKGLANERKDFTTRFNEKVEQYHASHGTTDQDLFPDLVEQMFTKDAYQVLKSHPIFGISTPDDYLTIRQIVDAKAMPYRPRLSQQTPNTNQRKGL